MESNEQAELARKMWADSEIESRMTASRGKLGVGGTEQKGKRTHGHGQRCGECWAEGAVRGLNGNGNNIRKIKKK